MVRTHRQLLLATICMPKKLTGWQARAARWAGSPLLAAANLGNLRILCNGDIVESVVQQEEHQAMRLQLAVPQQHEALVGPSFVELRCTAVEGEEGSKQKREQRRYEVFTAGKARHCWCRQT